MKTRDSILTIFAAACLGLAGCEKVETSTSYTIYPSIIRTDWVSEETQVEDETVLTWTQQTDTTALSGVVVHAFHADTALWQVASYQDALAGVLRSKTGEGTLEPAFSAGIDGSAELVLGPLRQKNVVLVICCSEEEERIYGWRMVEVPENLPHITLSLYARPYTKGEYTEAKWTLINETPSTEPEDPTPTDEEEEEEGGDESDQTEP